MILRVKNITKIGLSSKHIHDFDKKKKNNTIMQSHRDSDYNEASTILDRHSWRLRWKITWTKIGIEWNVISFLLSTIPSTEKACIFTMSQSSIFCSTFVPGMQDFSLTCELQWHISYVEFQSFRIIAHRHHSGLTANKIAVSKIMGERQIVR